MEERWRDGVDGTAYRLRPYVKFVLPFQDGKKTALVLSQVFLSLGIPFALIPLVRITSDRTLMGRHVNGRPLQVTAWVVIALVIALNLALVGLTVLGWG